MYTSVKDRNTRVVYEWVSNTGERVLVPRENWKTAEEWTQEEIEALFAKPVVEEVEEKVTEEPRKGLFG